MGGWLLSHQSWQPQLFARYGPGGPDPTSIACPKPIISRSWGGNPRKQQRSQAHSRTPIVHIPNVALNSLGSYSFVGEPLVRFGPLMGLPLFPLLNHNRSVGIQGTDRTDKFTSSRKNIRRSTCSRNLDGRSSMTSGPIPNRFCGNKQLCPRCRG